MTLWELIGEGLAGRLTWTEVQRRAREDRRCPYCGGQLEAKGRPEDRAWTCAACHRLHLEGAAPMDYELSRPAWQAGISVEEVLAFQLRPGYEAYVELLEDVELQRQLALAVARSEDASSRTPWLERYTGLLVDARRRRRGSA